LKGLIAPRRDSRTIFDVVTAHGWFFIHYSRTDDKTCRWDEKQENAVQAP
jgi:hypothetical protein